ncbi:MAG TPA: NAD(P)H-dependent oxidoreductase subunit E [Deinococcales bacterium]|nr:NAD(P)H-dependent oxidoreductase subunit E [Deinococcales bacterium]
MTRVELCSDFLSVEAREEILDALYQELRISPGEVSADGDFELEVVSCGNMDASGAPYLKLDGVVFAKVDARRARSLVATRRHR